MENNYLKDEFTSYLQSKDLAPSSILYYNKYVQWFFLHTQKQANQITKADILKYLEYLKNDREQSNQTRNNNLIGINHYFTFLTKKEAITSNPCTFLKIRGTKKTTLLRIYTSEELTQLYDNYYNHFVRIFDHSHIPLNQRKQSSLSKQRNAVILSILIHQGATTKEVELLELCDLDLMGASIKLRATKKSNSRTLPLQASQIGVLMYYLQTIRPEFLELNSNTESEKLFLTLPENSKLKAQKPDLMHVFKPFAKQVKEVDKHFLNFNQIRASVITGWLKVHGLRKTQVMAGHRYISSTEKYKLNDLQQLTDDISKLHPFQ